MRRLLVIAIVGLAVPAAVPVAALAKGPSAATISGPGLRTISVSGDGEDGAVSSFGRLTEAAGFFPAVFRREPDPMLRTRPSGDLGPRYTIVWVLPTPTGRSRLRQDVYPYAKPYPVTYTRPGQPFYNGMRTHGGWYEGYLELKRALAAAGLPARAPSTGGSTPTWAIALPAVAGVLVLGALGALGLRRRSRSPAAA